MRYITYLRKSSESEDRQELSIPAQERELKDLARKKGLTIAGTILRESKSAKTPGRPLFSEMLSKLQNGEADGILCWNLDRLARNPLDGGAIMWALGQGTIKEIVSPGRTYIGTGDDKLLMSIIFGMATKYSDDLSVNVKRGNQQALETGLWPSCPKLGYVRDQKTGYLVEDPERFESVKEMWNMLLDGETVPDILSRATNEWGFTTPVRGKFGNSPLSKSALYRLFHDIFYTGMMPFSGELFEGTHPAMVTQSEFQTAQRKISPTNLRPTQQNKGRFAYRGLITCGSCGAKVTAERKINRHGMRYAYYHCCRKSKAYGYCSERAIEVSDLEDQLREFIRTLYVPRSWMKQAIQKLAEAVDEQQAIQIKKQAKIENEIGRVRNRMKRLRELCAEGVITTEEYKLDKSELLTKQKKLEEKLVTKDRPSEIIEPFKDRYSFVEQALNKFDYGSQDEKRHLVQTLTSNLVLEDKKLHIQAKKPFGWYASWSRFPSWYSHGESNPDFQLEKLAS